MTQPKFNDALRGELLEMQVCDQTMRKTLADRYRPGAALEVADRDWALSVDHVADRDWAFSVDHANTVRLQEIVAQYGWPGLALVGEDGARAAWLLAQHADANPGFQEQCARLMADAVANGDAAPSDLAYLIDRIRVHTRQPQVYGTQVQFAPSGQVLMEIEDEAGVDERRAEVGLGPLAAYIAAVQKFRQGD